GRYGVPRCGGELVPRVEGGDRRPADTDSSREPHIPERCGSAGRLRGALPLCVRQLRAGQADHARRAAGHRRSADERSVAPEEDGVTERVLVALPTYNERRNLLAIVPAILDQDPRI